MVSYEGARLDERLDGVRAVAEVHLRHRAPATFFIVAELAVAAGTRLREILDHDLFDLQSHSFTHDHMVAIRARLMLGTTTSSAASRRSWHGRRRCRGATRHGSPPPAAR